MSYTMIILDQNQATGTGTVHRTHWALLVLCALVCVCVALCSYINMSALCSYHHCQDTWLCHYHETPWCCTHRLSLIFKLCSPFLKFCLFKNAVTSQGLVAHAYNLSYLGDWDQEDHNLTPAQQIVLETPSPKSPEQNGLEVRLKWWNACFASVKP
jgi:hypothetical protein